MKKIIIFILLIAVISWWLKTPSIDAPQAGVTFNYTVKYSGNADSEQPLPMVIALHGNGDTPGHFYDTAMDKITIPARIVLLEGPISMGRGNAWPMDNPELQHYSNAIAESVPRLLDKYPTRHQPILFGFSGGAVMAYYLAAASPERFSYIFPISGRLRQQQLTSLPDKPVQPVEVLAFHGIQDKLINISGGRLASRLLAARGTHIQLQEFEGGHLGVFTNMKLTISQVLDKKLKGLLYGP